MDGRPVGSLPVSFLFIPRTRSGIGNREDMQDAGLGKPIVELPVVGRRIQDHPAVGLVFQVNPPLVADIVAEYKHFSNWTEGRKLERYPLSFGYPGFSTGAFLHSGLKDPDDSSSRQELPDLQLTVFPLMIEPHISKRVSCSTTCLSVHFYDFLSLPFYLVFNCCNLLSCASPFYRPGSTWKSRTTVS